MSKLEKLGFIKLPVDLGVILARSDRSKLKMLLAHQALSKKRKRS